MENRLNLTIQTQFRVMLRRVSGHRLGDEYVEQPSPQRANHESAKQEIRRADRDLRFLLSLRPAIRLGSIADDPLPEQ